MTQTHKYIFVVSHGVTSNGISLTTDYKLHLDNHSSHLVPLFDPQDTSSKGGPLGSGEAELRLFHPGGLSLTTTPSASHPSPAACIGRRYLAVRASISKNKQSNNPWLCDQCHETDVMCIVPMKKKKRRVASSQMRGLNYITVLAGPPIPGVEWF